VPAHAAASQPDILRRLAETPPNKQPELLLAFVSSQVAKVLGLDSEQTINFRKPLNEMGLDSLMAVELRNMLSVGLSLGGRLPTTLVFDYPTIEALATYLAAQLLGSPAAEDGDGAGSQADQGDALSTIEELSDEEVDRLFAEKLRGL
jgi:acyl carrier protein